MTTTPARIEQLAKIGFAKRLADQLAQRVLRHAGGRRVHGCQRARQGLIVGDRTIARMHHLGTEKTVPNLAEDAQAAPIVAGGFQLFGLATVEVEEAQHQFAAGIGDTRHQLTARAKLYRHIKHLSLDLHRRTRQSSVDQRDAGFIFVTQRQVQHEIIAPRQTKLRQPGL